MSDPIIWLSLAGMLAICELFIGSFYLLLIAAAMLAASAAAAFGAPLAVQVLVASVFGVGSTLGLRRINKRRRSKVNAARDPNVNLDIGQSIPIEAAQWAGGRARVMYRGAPWDAELAPGANPAAGSFTIFEVRGSCLVVH